MAGVGVQQGKRRCHRSRRRDPLPLGHRDGSRSDRLSRPRMGHADSRRSDAVRGARADVLRERPVLGDRLRQASEPAQSVSKLRPGRRGCDDRRRRRTVDGRHLHHSQSTKDRGHDSQRGPAVDVLVVALAWRHQPRDHHRLRSWTDGRMESPESGRLSAALRSAGFRMVGPVVAHSFMQTAGIENGHFEGCFRAPA